MHNPESDSAHKLVAITVITRHGDRNPLSSVSFAPNCPSDGLLTEDGHLRMHKVGEQLRRRYIDTSVIPNEYHRNIFSFRSTNYPRTIDSLKEMCNGLFDKPVKAHESQDFVQYDIDAPDCADDYRLLGHMKGNGFEFLHEQCRTDEFLDKTKHYQTLIDCVEREVQEKKEGWYLVGLIDSILVQHELGSPLPNVFTEDFLQKLTVCRNDLCVTMIPFKKPSFLDAAVSQLANEIFVTDLEKSIQHQNSQSELSKYPTFTLYSAHDLNIIAFAGMMGVAPSLLYPYYGATLIIETYLDNTGDPQNGTFRMFGCFDPDINSSHSYTELVPSQPGRIEPTIRAIRDRFAASLTAE
ncbi:hypothetical protein BLNAU_869 [Blattamonas nauphoetae]|uniref:Acid phosphatase n=1 Tax=Blattamonas nauphoetae TaxID=2049346 RepID=A0ABQ9YKQ7_9EUKA|nr:hypothetical protein BLNAU_869 [Blattamonas nauphoetae]